MAKRPSYLRLFLTREREREGEGRRSGWRRHTALHPRRMQVLLQRENKRNGREGEGVGKKRVEENDSFYHYATRSRVYFLPFLNESVCVCVPQRRSPIQTRIVFRAVKWKQKATRREGKARRGLVYGWLPWPREPDTRRLASELTLERGNCIDS